MAALSDARMIRRGAVALTLAACLGAAPAGARQDANVDLDICLVNYDSQRGQARFRANIDWGGEEKRFARYDLAATDRSGATYLQFHDSRTMPPGLSQRQFNVGDVSLYPLSFFIVGMTAEAARAFDVACRQHGDCTIALKPGEVVQVSNLTEVSSQLPGRHPGC